MERLIQSLYLATEISVFINSPFLGLDPQDLCVFISLSRNSVLSQLCFSELTAVFPFCRAGSSPSLSCSAQPLFSTITRFSFSMLFLWVTDYRNQTEWSGIDLYSTLLVFSLCSEVDSVISTCL